MGLFADDVTACRGLRQDRLHQLASGKVLVAGARPALKQQAIGRLQDVQRRRDTRANPRGNALISPFVIGT